MTPSPNVVGTPPSGQNPDDPQNLFRVPVEDLGLVNPEYTLPDQDNPLLGTQGNRLVTYLWIEGSSPGAPDASVDIVDATDGTATVQKNIGTFVGDTEFYREGIFVPQGSMIRVRGMTGPVKVRLHIQFLNDALQLAKVLSAICCLEAPKLAEVPPPSITDNTNVLGVSSRSAREDHTHAHGARGGGSLHTLATTVLAGFMSPADKVKLNGISTGAGPRMYDAVVDPTGAGDFLLPSAAFASGAKTVFVRQGVYVEAADIVIPSDGCMVGDCPGGVIISLAAGFQVVMDGSGRQTLAGTVSVPTGSTTVTGVGTVFTALNPGDYIRLGDAFAQIGSITSNLSLELAQPYRGNAISGQSMKGQSMLAGSGIENVVLVGAPGSAIAMTQCLRCFFKAVAVQMCSGAVPGWSLVDCGEIILQTCASENNADIGIRALDSNSLFYLGCVFKNNGSHGIAYINCQATVLDGAVTTQNNADGIFVGSQSERIQLLDCIVSYNNGNGMETTPGSNGSILANSTFRNNGGAGIDFDGASDVVEGCLIASNGGDGISAGDDGVVSDCNILENGGRGISMQSDQNCAVTTCVIRDNGNDGILAGADSTITGNTISGNSGDGIRVPNAADDCVVSGNRAFGNSGDGIFIGNAAARTTLLGNNFRGNTGASINDNSATTIKDTGDAGGAYNNT